MSAKTPKLLEDKKVPHQRGDQDMSEVTDDSHQLFWWIPPYGGWSGQPLSNSISAEPCTANNLISDSNRHEASPKGSTRNHAMIIIIQAQEASTKILKQKMSWSKVCFTLIRNLTTRLSQRMFSSAQASLQVRSPLEEEKDSLDTCLLLLEADQSQESMGGKARMRCWRRGLSSQGKNRLIGLQS